MISEAGYLLEYVYIGAEATVVDAQFVWNDGTLLTSGTSLWEHSSEGYNEGEDCTVLMAGVKIVHTSCTTYDLAFLCQCDI